MSSSGLTPSTPGHFLPAFRQGIDTRGRDRIDPARPIRRSAAAHVEMEEGQMRVPAFEGAARFGAAALAALTVTVPGDLANRPAPLRDGQRKLDKRYLDRDAAFNPKRRAV